MIQFNKAFTIEIDLNSGWENPENDEIGCAWGKITIGDFYEHFYMSPSVWKISDYLKQWDLAWKRLQKHDTSCFVVNYQKNPFVDLWCMYKEDNIICIQNKLIIDEIYKKRIGNITYTPENSFDFIPPRLTEENRFDDVFWEREPILEQEKSDLQKLIEAHPISEWYVSILKE